MYCNVMIDEGKKNDDNNHELPNNIDESIFFKHQITKLIVEVYIAVIQMVQLSTIIMGSSAAKTRVDCTSLGSEFLIFLASMNVP